MRARKREKERGEEVRLEKRKERKEGVGRWEAGAGRA